jgi:hypothetical protein
MSTLDSCCCLIGREAGYQVSHQGHRYHQVSTICIGWKEGVFSILVSLDMLRRDAYKFAYRPGRVERTCCT